MHSTKIASILITAILLYAPATLAGEYQANKTIGGLEIQLTIDKNPPVVGDNKVTIAIKDETGKPVTDASVRVEYSMAAMPGMPAMNYKSDASLNGETYTASISPAMAGPWLISTKILRANKIQTAKFNVDVQ